ncbi:MAG: alpha/beta fold hydrolase, partial [Verrucomicrobiales bacterium]
MPILLSFLASAVTYADSPLDGVPLTHSMADSDGVKIHYVIAGEKNPGAPIIMIHGFPDFWYTWRHQMAELSKTRRVVAIDMRGYN